MGRINKDWIEGREENLLFGYLGQQLLGGVDTSCCQHIFF